MKTSRDIDYRVIKPDVVLKPEVPIDSADVNVKVDVKVIRPEKIETDVDTDQ